MGEAGKRAVSKNIQFATPALNIAVFHDEEFHEHNLDVEIQQAVVGRYHDTEAMKFKKIEETTTATLTFKGQYDLLPRQMEKSCDGLLIITTGLMENASTYIIYLQKRKNRQEIWLQRCAF